MKIGLQNQLKMPRKISTDTTREELLKRLMKSISMLPHEDQIGIVTSWLSIDQLTMLVIGQELNKEDRDGQEY